LLKADSWNLNADLDLAANMIHYLQKETQNGDNRAIFSATEWRLFSIWSARNWEICLDPTKKSTRLLCLYPTPLPLNANTIPVGLL